MNNNNREEFDSLVRRIADRLTEEASGSISTNSASTNQTVVPLPMNNQPPPPPAHNQLNRRPTGPLNTSQSGPVRSGQLSTNAIEEHRNLFGRNNRLPPYGRRNQSSQQNRRAAKKEKSITRTMFCLACKDATETPSAPEKLDLHRNGLGEKRVSFPTSATSAVMKDLLYEAFPTLRHSGGFQLLISKEKSRKELRVVNHGSCSAEQLRCMGTGRIYVRPLQRNIALANSMEVSVEFEECLQCFFSVPISEMQEHRNKCIGLPISSDDESGIDITVGGIQSGGGAAQVESSENVMHVHDDDLHIGNAIHGNGSATRVRDDAVYGGVPENVDLIVLVEDGEENRSPADNQPANIVAEIDRENIPYAEHLRKAIDRTVSEMIECQEPVTVLRVFQKHFLRGRPLDLESDSELCEGKTTEIFLSRLNLFEDAMDELVNEENDRSIPLEITFNGECARDYGGPRREFLSTMLREIRDRLFQECTHENGDGYLLTEDESSIMNKYYFGAGVIFGYAMLQGGPLPCFLTEKQMTRIFGNELVPADNSRKPAENQFYNGISCFGLIELFQKKPCLLHLLRKTAVGSITYPKLAKLLTPSFSDVGTNKRLQEEKAYRFFLNYIKEVAASRRGSTTLEDILKFITGAENEPVLGFTMKPVIYFDDHMLSCLPTGNTCINRLTLAIGDNLPSDQETMFNFFDYAFVNAYFGMV